MIDTDKKRRSTFAVLFYINRTKVRKDGLCQLLCKISIDGEAAQIGTKVSLDPKLWDPSAGRANGRSRNALEINRAIDRLTADIQAHYNHIRTELGFVSAMLVKNAVQGIAQKPRTLLALFREHNEEFGKRVGIDRTAESHASYVNSYKHLASFLHRKYGLEDIPLRHLDVKFYDTFDLYLRADCGMMQKSVHEHLYHLKKMTRRAVSQGTLRYDPYCKLHPPQPPYETRRFENADGETDRPAQPRQSPRLVPFLDLHGTGLCRLETVVGKRYHAVGRWDILVTYPSAKNGYALGGPPARYSLAYYREISSRA